MDAAPFASPLAAALAGEVLARFLRYAVIDTQADPAAHCYPSSAKQLTLSLLLEQELQALGLAEVRRDAWGYLTATLPGTPGAPTIGLLAHLDTSPDAPGGPVLPLVHPCYDGEPIVLPGDPSQVLDPAQLPELAARVGCALVTSDGTTLLGADDKAGVAAIMTGLAELVRRPGPRATLRIAFTLDEELGRGVAHFDSARFGASAAYTLDAGGCGTLQTESFAARQLQISFHGSSEHPGRGKGTLVNAVKLAAAFVAALPRDRLSPETTEGREGFVHPSGISGGVEQASVTVLLRAFEPAQLDEQEVLLRGLAEQVVAAEPRAGLRIEAQAQYDNMREAIARRPEVVARAEQAYRRAGVEPVQSAIRGGTDGAVLSARGLPTPNLFTGTQDPHSRREWLCVQDLAAAAAVVVELAQVWAE